MPIDIERKSVPIPKERGTRGRKSNYPFAAMKIGKSFFVSVADAENSYVRSSASNFAKAHKGFRFTVSKTKPPEPPGCRVWRIA